jgi:hypothetical protein
MGSELKRLAEWVLILLFFIIAPPITLYAVYWIALLVSPAKDAQVVNFANDLSMFVFSFYAGCTGAVVGYIYARFHSNVATDAAVTKIAKILLGGLLGVAAFLTIKSAFIVKVLYPSLDISRVALPETDYKTTLSVAILIGIIGPGLIKRLQDRAQRGI